MLLLYLFCFRSFLEQRNWYNKGKNLNIENGSSVVFHQFLFLVAYACDIE